MSDKIGVYPGTFDPITNGHLDIIVRALMVFDTLIIAIAADCNKSPVFSMEERLDMVNSEIKHLHKRYPNKKIVAKSFNGLLVDFVKEQNSSMIVRGLRAVSDFEYEFQMSAMNLKLAPDVQTLFLPATEKTQFIASRIVKEIARLGGDISGFVSEYVEAKLKKYYKL